MSLGKFVAIGMYALQDLELGDKIYKPVHYTERGLGCILYRVHNNKVYWIKGDHALIRSSDWKKHPDIKPKYLTDEYEYTLLHEEPTEPPTFNEQYGGWWTIGAREDVPTLKDYKKRTTKADFVRSAEIVQALKPVMLPHMPGFTTYDRGKLECWQKLVHMTAAQLFDTSDVRKDGTKLFDMQQFLVMCGATDTPNFDKAQMMVAGDKVA